MGSRKLGVVILTSALLESFGPHQSWLLENFVFGDNVCVYVAQKARQAWDVPRVADGHLYTRCA